MKNKISILTQQDMINTVAADLCWFIFGPFTKTEDHVRIKAETDALSHPIKVEDILHILEKENILKEYPSWWADINNQDAFKPRCDCCKQKYDRLLVIHEICEGTHYSEDLKICKKCIDALKIEIEK